MIRLELWSFLFAFALHEISGLTLNYSGTYIILSQSVTLDCSLDGSTWSSSRHRQWFGPPSLTLMINNGVVQAGYSQYEEILDPPGQKFSLKIKSLNKANLDKVYRCTYGFSSATHTLSGPYENWGNATEVENSNGNNVSVEISYTNIRPLLTITATVGTVDVSSDVLSSSTLNADGYTYTASYGVASKQINDGETFCLSLTTPGGYSYNYSYTAPDPPTPPPPSCGCPVTKQAEYVECASDKKDDDNEDDDLVDEEDKCTESSDEEQDYSDFFGPETWENATGDELDEDLGLPVHSHSTVKSVNDLFFWILFFILYWQSVCHVSDNGVEWLLRFMFQFFNVLSCKVNHSLIAELAISFPTYLYMLRNLLKFDRNNFERYVVCPECFSVYTFYECYSEHNGTRKTHLCSNETLIRGRGRRCGHPLLKEVVLKGGVVKLYPYKVYCYNSLINGIEHILQKKGFPDLMCHWKQWNQESDTFRDVYDGNIWKSFSDFFNGDRNLGLMLNIDWFQPFKHRNDYSVGVIYFVILNLPRHIRYKFENVIVVGLIPALKKEPKDLSPFLTPIVKELQVLWKGVVMKTSISRISLTIKAALLCVACDIPAARKTCGFKSHSALLACHKCYKKFPAASFGAKRNYSGFIRENWSLRTKTLHNNYAKKVKNARNKTEHNELSRRFGTYYSVLIELPYFDAVRFCIIDPMHNLFLGTAKSMFKLWKEKNILDEGKMEEIEARLKSVNDVTDIGRIPHKISSNYGCYNAAEWKNWTVIFSLYCLRGILSDEHVLVWEKFVLACRILCNPFLTSTDITKADHLLLNFCQSFERLYTWKDVKPNMHLHCHLKDCLLDYGPIHVFWCFSFERFNGKFGQFKTNNRCVEIQFMRHIVTAKHCEKLAEIGSDNVLQEFFQDLFAQENNQPIDTPSIIEFLQFSRQSEINFSRVEFSNIIKVPEVYKIQILDAEDMVLLLDAYRHMFPSTSIELCNLSECVRKFGHIEMLGEKFGSKLECRSLRSANILASWQGDDGEIDILPDYVGLKPCKADFYFSHVITVGSTSKRHIFAKVKWYGEYSERNKYGNQMQMWYHKKFVNGQSSCFVPVERIRSRFTYGLTGQSRDLMLISSIPHKIYSDNMCD